MKKICVPFTSKLLLLLYIFFIIRFHLKGIQIQFADPSNILFICSGILTILLLSRIIQIIFGKIPSAHAIINIFMLVLYLILGFYHLRSGENFDYSILSDNASLIFYPETAGLISGFFRTRDYVLFAILILLPLLLEWKYKKLSRPPVFKHPWKQLPIIIIAYLGLLLYSPYSYDEFSCFFQSVQKYHFPKDDFIKVTFPEKKYPYIKLIKNEKKIIDTPNVFIVMVESFNANVVKRKTPELLEYTPFFNSLINQGLYFENVFGVSVQTSKGQLATFCSILPISRKKVFTHYHDLKLNCLPEILKSNGYETFFFQGFSDLGFDNTGRFMKQNGFNHVHSMNSNFISPEEQEKHYWGWGIQDDILYLKSFEYLDTIHKIKSKNKKDNTRYFTVISTVSNHMKFKKVPKKQRYLYPNQNNKKQYFANSIRVTDEYLKKFFIELKKRPYLKNSIIIITGDHSFPAGEHGNYSSEIGYFNENFKIPLIILGLKNIQNRTIKKAYSQIDIAPTILEILGISTKTHFTGTSMLGPPPELIYLIQPYSGRYLGVISYPYKYIFHQKTKNEFLFNLNNDPDENENLISLYKKSTPLLVNKLHSGLKDIIINDHLIEMNRIWSQ